jgi:hypothetical protein
MGVSHVQLVHEARDEPIAVKVSANGRGRDKDSDGDTDGGGDPIPPDVSIVLNAYVIEMGTEGTFLTLAGVIQSEVDENEFDFKLFSGQGYGEDEFCGKHDSACDAQGVCEVKPEACPDIFDPVCGCDSETYVSACVAMQLGVTIDSAG